MHEKTATTTTRVQFIDDTELNSALFILNMYMVLPVNNYQNKTLINGRERIEKLRGPR